MKKTAMEETEKMGNLIAELLLRSIISSQLRLTVTPVR